MRRYDPQAEMLRLRRQRDEALERERVALAHRDAMQRQLDATSKKLAERINRNNDLWNAAAKVQGGLEAFRAVHWTA